MVTALSLKFIFIYNKVQHLQSFSWTNSNGQVSNNDKESM